jgi:pimeloyl-ACP methyl ester carboxylesterase/DNA-binding CsgD family transcriptional regulator
MLRYVQSADGTRIAWCESGAGPQTIVLAANHITDIKSDRIFPRRWDIIEHLSERFRVVRYDHRGCGSSQRNVERQGQDAWVEDLDAVIRAASPEVRVILSAPSQAAPYGAVFAARHPQRLSHLILHGCCRCGAVAGGSPSAIAHHNAMIELIRIGWDSPNPQTRTFVAAAFVPDPSSEGLDWARRLPSMINREDALRFFKASAEQDARAYTSRITTPTLVAAFEGDPIVPPELSRSFAAAIPSAHYIEYPGGGHVPTKGEGRFEAAFDHLVAFVSKDSVDDPLSALTSRERDILDGVRAGLSNEAIALQRNLSPRTVRNHLSRIFDKLRVNSRTQAALLASRSEVRRSN